MSFEAYKVAVRLTLVNHVSTGLLGLSRDLRGVHGDAMLAQRGIESITGELTKIKRLGLIGGVMAGVGFAGLATLKGPYEEAKKYAQAQADFRTLNLSEGDNAEAFGKAAAMSQKILGTTLTENVKSIHDLHTAFGDLHHALATADTFAKLSIVAKVANHGAPVDGIVNAAAKALEHRGGSVVNNQAEFDSEANMMTQVMLATKMRVSPKDYLTASGTGKMAYQLYDKDYLYGNFAGLMSINGAARTGTEGMTAFSSLIGGHMDSKGKGFLADLGLWQEGFSKKRLNLMNAAMKGLSPEERKTAVASMGGQAVISGGLADADAELFAHRPDLFIAKLVPLIRKRFGMDLDDDQVALLLAKNFNRSTGNFLGTQVTMAGKLEKDTNIIHKAMGISEGYQHYLKSPEGAEEASDAAWKNLKTVIGSIYIQPITNGLLSLANGLTQLSGWIDAHPNLTKGLVYGFIALSGAMAIGGVILMAVGAIKGFRLAMSVLGAGDSAIATATKAVRLFGRAFGWVGAAASAFAFGWTIGTLLYDAWIQGTKFSDWLGGLIAKLLAFFGNKEAQEAIEGHKSAAQRASEANAKRQQKQADDRYAAAIDKPFMRSMLESVDRTLFGSHQRSLVPPPATQVVQVNTQLNMDGRKVGEAVTTHQVRSLARPPTGPSGADTSMALAPVSHAGTF